jgi:hypothetical protein
MGKLILDLYESLWLDENGDLHFVPMDGGRAGANWRLIATNPDLRGKSIKISLENGEND